MQIRVIDSTKFMVAPLHPFFTRRKFLTVMIAFILGDLCRYPAVGWGKDGLFPREGQQNILFVRVIVMTSMNKRHHIGYVGLSA
ncbi:Uncharacterised protein [Klebsiella pneumoniae]|uniref:Uncharacterized protein n=1 Tax=Klebsiella pneumoniae TaxID=573 RepID=A0A3S4KJE4_KLEPN|nr:Uncharacterised protein [Klebsiella pneumoniae]